MLGVSSVGLKTGYAMKKHVEGSVGHHWSEGYGQIYPILRQLVDEGLANRTEERRKGEPMPGAARRSSTCADSRLKRSDERRREFG